MSGGPGHIEGKVGWLCTDRVRHFKLVAIGNSDVAATEGGGRPKHASRSVIAFGLRTRTRADEDAMHGTSTGNVEVDRGRVGDRLGARRAGGPLRSGGSIATVARIGVGREFIPTVAGLVNVVVGVTSREADETIDGVDQAEVPSRKLGGTIEHHAQQTVLTLVHDPVGEVVFGNDLTVANVLDVEATTQAQLERVVLLPNQLDFGSLFHVESVHLYPKA